jgi:hypothetical protein
LREQLNNFGDVSMNNAKLVAACAAALGLAVLTSNAALGANASSSSGKLGQRAEQLLLQAEQAGKSRVVLLIAVKSGASNQAVAGISSLGGQIQFRDDTLAYLRASVPVAQVRSVAALASVQAVELDEMVPLPDPRPEPEGIAPLVPQPAPNAATPRNNPYLPIGDTGASPKPTRRGTGAA